MKREWISHGRNSNIWWMNVKSLHSCEMYLLQHLPITQQPETLGLHVRKVFSTDLECKTSPRALSRGTSPCQEAAPSAQHCPCSRPLTFLTLPPNMGQRQEAGVGPWHCHPLSHVHLDEAPRSHWKQARGSTAKQRVSFRQTVRKGHALHNTWLLESAQ